MRSVCTSLALLLAAATMPAFAQSTVTLDATSGTNTISTNYSTTGGLTLNMGFFADYLVLAGGGGGGGSGDSSTAYGGGGGGAGGLLSGTTTLSGSSYSVVVGGGGAGGQYSATAANQQGSNGANSVFGAITATGGGGGGSFKVAGSAGGSGGGGGGRGAGTDLRTPGGTGTAGQGFDGGASRDDNASGRSAGGGGGGAGAAGGNGGTNVTTAGNGGAGLASTITGTSVTYGGGGGGGAMDTNDTSEVRGTGGAGGGGDGSLSGNAEAGTDGLGGGGGGVGNGGAGGQGGAGIVIVRYQGASLGNIGGTVTSGSGSAAGYTLHKFTTTGTSALNLSGVNMNARLGATLTGSLSGAGGLTYNGPGTLTLTGSNPYSGGTALLSGTLALGSAAAIGSTGPISFGGGTLRFSAANTTDYSARFSTAANQAYALDTNGQSVTLASPLAGPGASLTKLGTGTLALAGGNSFTAGTVLGGGVLRLGSADALGSTGPISFVGGTLQFTAANTTDYSTRFSTAAGQAYALDTNGQDVTFATSLSSTGGSLTKVGAGTLTLTGALNLAGSNLFDTSDDGRTRVAAGTLVLPGGASLNGSHLTVDGTGAGSTAAMLITGGSMGPKGTRDFGGTGLTVGSQGVGVLTINAGALSGHSLTIGDQAGSNGTVTVNGGTTNLSGALYVAARGVGMLTLNAGQVNSDYLIAVGSGDGTVGTLTMTGGTLTTVGADSLGGYIGNASSGILQMSGGRADFRGLFIGVHSGGISGTGTLIVSGGTVAVQERFWLGHGIGTAGTLNILDTGVVDVGSGTGAITLAFTGSNSSGVLNIGTGATAGTLLAGTVEGARSTARVNFNHTGTTSFSPALTGTMNVSKLGGGTTILTGSSTFTGTTTISAGTLQVGDGGTNGWLGDSPVVNNAVLVFDRSDSTTYGGTISGQGSLTKLGAGATTLTGSNTYSGTTTIVAGTLEVATGGSIVSGSTMDVRNGTLLVTGGRIDANQTWIGTTTGSAGVVTVTGGTLASSGDLRVGMGPAGSGTGTLTISNGGVVDVGGQIYKADTSTINLNAGGTLRVADSIYTPLVNDGTLVFTGVQTQQIGIPITGTGAMVAAGPLLYVNGSFGSTGGMTIAGGTVQVTPPGSLAGDVVNNGGELAFLLGGSKTFAGAMSGSGGLFVNGWTLTLTGSSTFTGVTMVGDQGVSAGRLEVGNGGTTGSLVSDILVARSSSVVFNRSDVVTYAGSITGQGRLAKLGAGTLTLTGSSGFTGGATVTGGTLSVGNSGTAGSLPGNVTLGKDTGLVFNRSDSIGFTGNISGKGSLTKLGSGALTLSGSNSFTGQTTVSAGTLILNGSSALAPTAAVVVAGGATLQANQPIRIGYLDSAGTVVGGGNLSATLTVTRSGSIGGIADGSDSQGMFAAGIAKLGTGTSTVSAPNTYTGLTWVREGTLGVGVSNAFSGSSSLTVDSGATFDRAGFSQSVNGAAINGSLANTGGGGLLTVTGTLSGSGLVNGNLLVAGDHAPGNSPGSQTFTGDLTYAAGAAVNWELVANTTGSAGTLSDQIVLPTGSLAFSGSTALNLSFDADGSTVNWSDPFWDVDRAWLVYDLSAGTTTGIGNFSVATVDWLDANAAALSSVRPGSSFSVGLSGQDVVLNYVAAVPEPGSLAVLFTAGAIGLGLRRRKAQAV